jgi:two-component system, cell cycle sensor histidine kinase and response regulator CckA
MPGRSAQYVHSSACLVLGLDVAPSAQLEHDHLVWLGALVFLFLSLSAAAVVFALRRQDRARRQQTETQHREQRELQRLLFEQAPGGVAVSNLQFQFIEVNQVFCALLGYTREELIGVAFPQLTHPADRAETLEANQRLARGEAEHALLEKRYLHKNGSIIDVLTNVGLIRDEAGHPQYLVGHITDITSQRKVEAELQIRQQQLATLLARTPLVLFAINAEGNYTLSEGAGLTVLGRKPGEAVGQSIYDRYAARPDIIADIRRGLAGDTFTVRREINGAVFEIYFTPLRGTGDKVTGLSGVALDITGRDSAERARKKTERQIFEEQKLESLGLLAGGVAHDFNNLLTAVLGNASLARLELPTGSPVLGNLTQIEQASQTAAGLCQQLLAYSGRGRLEMGELDLGELVRETADRLRPAAGSRVQLQLELTPRLPAIIADRNQLRQVIQSLVLNSLEMIGGRNGVVQIMTRLESITPGWLENARIGQDILPGEYVVLEIKDNGPGLSPETQERIFDPFFSTKAKGRGLGLAASLGVMRSHHGALRLWSQPGSGTRFVLVFPPHGERVARPEPVSAGSGWQGHGRVLIVDDEDNVRATAAQMTAYFGFEVRQAGSGQQALELVRRAAEPFDLVLLDLTMPEMDGFATFTAIRQLRPTQRIVVFSGYSEQDAQQRFAGQNLTGFLQKPFSADALRDILRLTCP